MPAVVLAVVLGCATLGATDRADAAYTATVNTSCPTAPALFSPGAPAASDYAAVELRSMRIENVDICKALAYRIELGNVAAGLTTTGDYPTSANYVGTPTSVFGWNGAAASKLVDVSTTLGYSTSGSATYKSGCASTMASSGGNGQIEDSSVNPSYPCNLRQLLERINLRLGSPTTPTTGTIAARLTPLSATGGLPVACQSGCTTTTAAAHGGSDSDPIFAKLDTTSSALVDETGHGVYAGFWLLAGCMTGGFFIRELLRRIWQ